MNAPAPIVDASDLLAVVERARALLDEGDVLAARMLAAGAYDQAKAAAAYGERFGAAERLVTKARRLQGDALLIEARAKVRLADEWDAAQAEGKALKGRPKSVPDGNTFTQAEAGLSAKEIHEARKLRDAERGAPGIVERAIAARLAAALEPSRASLRHAIGTRSATKEERGNNLYETPREAMAVLLALEEFSHRIWEPACGRGAIARELEAAGHDVILTDLVDYGTANQHGECQEVGDFLETRRAKDGIRGPWRGALQPATDIVTNPPYGECLNAFVAHALAVHKPRKMALLLNLNFICGTDDDNRNFALDENPPARIIVFARRLPMMHRDGYEGKKSTSQMNTAWFIWEQDEDGQYRGAMQARRVDWKDFATSPATSSRPDEEVEAVAPPPAAASTDRPSVTEAELAEWKALGALESGVSIDGPLVERLIDRGLVWKKKPPMLTVGGGQRLAELDRLVSAASDGDGVNVTKETSPGGELCPGQEAEAVPKSAASADRTYPADLVPGRTATEISVGGMKKGSFARITFHRNDDGSFAIGMEYELKGFCGGASPTTGEIAQFDDALLLALSEMERRLGEVEGDQSSECGDHHRAAARAGRKWCAERRREWGLA